MAEVWAGAAPEQLAWGAMLVLLLSGIGRILGGFALLRIAPRVIAHLSILLLAFIFAGLFSAKGAALLLPLALLAAFFSSVNFGAIFHLASTAVPQGSLATLIGFINFLANLGAVLFTLLFGICKDATGTFAWAFAVEMLLAAGAVILGRRLLKREDAGPGTGR
jgi:nitrate/nitrite transporter NarK